MKNKKIVNLLRSIADMMDDTDEVIVKKEEPKKEEVKDNSRVHALDLMKKIDQLDTVRAYKNKVTQGNRKLSETLKKIDELREEAIKGLSKGESGIPLEIREKMLEGTKNEKLKIEDALKEAMENAKVEVEVKP